MSTMNDKLVSWLFDTKAVRVCPQDKPFWYTSGTIGPYYINTHFLYGSEEKANDLLKLIDVQKSSKFTCPLKVLEETLKNYGTDSIYKGLIDEMVMFIKKNIDLGEVEYISGGERRDWFFSLIIAQMLDKPHITIYKDLKTVVSCNGDVKDLCRIEGSKVLHIADLITEASSYERAWIPAIREHGADIVWSVVVVDRKQGGDEVLAREGVKSFAMVNIDKSLFSKVLDMGYINDQQYNMIIGYMKNPKEAMKGFLTMHPEFLKNALESDEKTSERAKLCLEKNIYDL